MNERDLELALTAKGWRRDATGAWTKAPPPDEPDAPPDAVDCESELHNEIMRVCDASGWLALHGSMAHRAYRTKGEWDFVILAEYPVLLLVECKTKTGKLTREQGALAAWATRLGWQPTVVRSLSEFATYCRTLGAEPKT